MSSPRSLYHLNTDHSFGTYSTNYLLGSVSLAFVFAIVRNWRFCNQRPNESSNTWYEDTHPWIALHMWCLAWAALFGGLVHQFFFDATGASIEWHIFWRLTTICTALGCGATLMLVFMFLGGQVSSKTGKLFGFIVAVVIFLFTLDQLRQPSLFVVGLLFLVTNFLALLSSLFYICRLSVTESKINWSIFSIGVLLLIVGAVFQTTMGSDCGMADTTNCAFPDHFNHNAVFHLIQLAGYTCVGLSSLRNMWFKQSSSLTSAAGSSTSASATV